MKTVAYLGISKDTQGSNNKNMDILNYAIKHHIAVDEIIEVDMSGQPDQEKPRGAEVMDLLKHGDMLIVWADRPRT